MSGIDIIVLLEIIAPVILLIVYGRIKIARARHRAENSEAAPVPVFEPKPEPTPGFFLSRFSTPQRAYLRQQITLGKSFYYVATYIFAALFTSGLWPSSVDHYGLEKLLEPGVWYSYLDHISFTPIVLVMMMAMAAMITVQSLTTGAHAIFNRTRPLTCRFLFWARMLAAITTILASLATAIAVSFVFLLLFYGPVWLRLLDTLNSGTVISRQQEMHFVHLFQTSVPRLFLSLGTTSLLVFSVAVLLLILGCWFPNKRNGMGTAIALPLGAVGSVLVLHMTALIKGPTGLLVSRAFFFYTNLGPPPPYGCMFVPVLTSAALLLIAQVLMRRVEL